MEKSAQQFEEGILTDQLELYQDHKAGNQKRAIHYETQYYRNILNPLIVLQDPIR